MIIRLLAGVFAAAGACFAVDLSPETIAAFDRYVAAAEAKMEPRFRGERFLGEGDSAAWRQQLRNSPAIATPAAGNGVISVKNGLVQDWTGAIFVPGATLRHAMSVAQDYERHKEYYKPEIADAKVRSHTGDRYEVFLRIVKSKLWISGVFNSEHEIQFTNVDSRRTYSRSYSRRIAEVADAGKKSEHELKPGHDRGFFWRLYSYWFFEESDGGVYVSCRGITLTRDLPFALDRLMSPILKELPGESLRNSLEQTKKAILGIALLKP